MQGVSTAQGRVGAADKLVGAAGRGEQTQSRALALCRFDPELMAPALMAAARRIAELESRSNGAEVSASTPPGMSPAYAKANKTKRGKRPEVKNGHQDVCKSSAKCSGYWRAPPVNPMS